MSDLVDLAARDESGDDPRVDLIRKQWAKFQGDAKNYLEELRVKVTRSRFRKPDNNNNNKESTLDANNNNDDAGTVARRWSVRSTLDLYARFTLTQAVRVRAKTSLYPMRYVAIKGEASGYIGRAPDISLEIKLLDVLKYRMIGYNNNNTNTRSSGNYAQLRIRTPLKLKGAEMDVIYERRSLLSSSNAGYYPRDGVRVAFRFADAAYLKVPSPTVAVKSQTRILKPFKTTLRIKRCLEPPIPIPIPATANRPELTALERLDRVGNILLGRRPPVDNINNADSNSRPHAPASSSSAGRRPVKRAQEREEEYDGEEQVGLLQSVRKFLTTTVKADDVGVDAKFRWIDTRG